MGEGAVRVDPVASILDLKVPAKEGSNIEKINPTYNITYIYDKCHTMTYVDAQG